MSYSVIGIGCTLFSIVRSCSGSHGCHNSNPEPDRIEMIIMDGKSQKISAAEWVEYPSKKGKFYAAIGYCKQPCIHQQREHTNQPQGAYAYEDTHQPWGDFRCKLRFASEDFSNAYICVYQIVPDCTRKPNQPAPVVLMISVPGFFS